MKNKYIVFTVLLFLSFSLNNKINAAPSNMKRLLSCALKRVGYRGRMYARGKRFNNDCSGFISMIYWKNGINLLKGLRGYRGYNKVKAIFKAALARGDKFFRKLPQPCDLVFFDRTYDANRNGTKHDDILTHIGIVVSVDVKTGNVYYVHNVNPRLGVKKYVLNLRYPKKRTVRKNGRLIKVNDYITRGGLSGEHTRGFIRLKSFPRINLNSSINRDMQNNEQENNFNNRQRNNRVRYKIVRFRNGRVYKRIPIIKGKIHGRYLEYYITGVLRKIVPFKNGKINGKVIGYWPNKKVFSVTYYRNNVKVGKHVYFYKNGRVKQIIRYNRRGQLHGWRVFYSRYGRRTAAMFYKNGRRIR